MDAEELWGELAQSLSNSVDDSVKIEYKADNGVIDDELFFEIKEDKDSEKYSYFGFEILKSSKYKGGSLEISGISEALLKDSNMLSLDKIVLYIHKGFYKGEIVWLTFTIDAVLDVLKTFGRQKAVKREDGQGAVILVCPQDKVVDYCSKSINAFLSNKIDENWYVDLFAMRSEKLPEDKAREELENVFSNLDLEKYDNFPIFVENESDEYNF